MAGDDLLLGIEPAAPGRGLRLDVVHSLDRELESMQVKA